MPVSSAASLGVLWVAVCVYHALGLAYDGSECTGLVQFDLRINTSSSTSSSSSSTISSLDGEVATALSSFPVYITYSCKAALRRYYCLDIYTPEATFTTSMCAWVCQEVLDSCAILLEEAAKESSFGLYFYDSLKVCAEPEEQQQQTSVCVNGSTAAYFSQDEPKCFYQTVVPDAQGASFALEPSACALPCPGGVFHNIYPVWYKLFLILTVVSVIAASFTTYAFAKKYSGQRRERSSLGSGISALRSASVFPVLMFCVGGLIQSFVNLSAFINELFQPTCEGNAKWRPATSTCYVQSVTILGCGVWSSCWSFVIAFEASSAVFFHINPVLQHRIRAWYVPATIATTTASAMVIHLVLREVDMFQVPFCAPSTLKQSGVSLLCKASATPCAVLVSLSSIILLVVMVKVRQVGSNLERSVAGQQSSASSRRSSHHTYLLRIILLVFCYNFVVLTSSSLCFNEQINAPKYKTNGVNYYTCLFTYSISDPQRGRDICGDVSQWDISPPLWVFPFYIATLGSYGLIPFLVFGLHYKFRRHGLAQRIANFCDQLRMRNLQPTHDDCSLSSSPKFNFVLALPSRRQPFAKDSSSPSPSRSGDTPAFSAVATEEFGGINPLRQSRGS